MSSMESFLLPRFEQTLLRALARIAPAEERGEWARTWHAEIWYRHERRLKRADSRFASAIDLALGMTCDAFWLRREEWRRAFSGTATLCLLSLSGLNLLAAALAVMLLPRGLTVVPAMIAEFNRSLFSAPLIILVVLGTGARRPVDRSSTAGFVLRIQRSIFSLFKAVLILLLSFVLSADLTIRLHHIYPNIADLAQVFCFILMALIGLRWAMHDQEQRCKLCLCALSTPARVGRPSHNLLEWNGTELSCNRGHGHLSVPEMETSWCRSSHWVTLGSAWDEPTRT